MNNTKQIVSHLGQFTIYFSSIYLLQGLYIQNCSRGVHSTVWTNEPTETEQKINFQSVLQKFGSDFSRALGGTLGKIRFGTDENRQPTNLIEVFKKNKPNSNLNTYPRGRPLLPPTDCLQPFPTDCLCRLTPPTVIVIFGCFPTLPNFLILVFSNWTKPDQSFSVGFNSVLGADQIQFGLEIWPPKAISAVRFGCSVLTPKL